MSRKDVRRTNIKKNKKNTHPTQWARRNDSNAERRTRSADVNQLSEAYGGKIITSTFISDAAKLWNSAPDSVKQCETLYTVKKTN